MLYKLKKILFSAVAALLCIFILEAVLSVAGYHPDSFKSHFRLNVCGELLGKYDENLFWRLEQDTDQYLETEFEKDNLKIMCLADSSSVMYKGKGYPDILQELLSGAIPQKNPIVFNGGVPGYTSFQGLKYFTGELLFYKPDIVSVCYGWNDHSQSGNKLSDKLQDPASPKNIFVRNIINKSRILSFINSLVMKIRQYQYKRLGPDESVRVSIKDYRYNLLKFVEICKNEDVLIILMTAPYLDATEEWITIHKEYNSVVRQIAREKDIPIVDIVEIFKRRRDLFIDPDTDKSHYNWKGSQVIAKALADVILGELEPNQD